MSNLFHLSLLDGNFFFFGPEAMTRDDFNEFCWSLLDEAGWAALVSVKEEGTPRLITWRDITKHFLTLLDKHGFAPVEPKWVTLPSYELQQSMVPWWMARSGPMINEWNQVIKADLQQRLSTEHELEEAKKIASKPGELDRLKRLIAVAEEMNKDA